MKKRKPVSDDCEYLEKGQKKMTISSNDIHDHSNKSDSIHAVSLDFLCWKDSFFSF